MSDDIEEAVAAMAEASRVRDERRMYLRAKQGEVESARAREGVASEMYDEAQAKWVEAFDRLKALMAPPATP